MLIALEGLDQAGKETQGQLLRDGLRADGRRARLLSFPDYGTSIGEEIARALQGERDYRPDVMQLLYVANRYERKADLVRWLEAGLVVVCDRYVASSVAYGEAQGLDIEWLDQMQRFLPAPQMTFLLDIPPSWRPPGSRSGSTGTSATWRCSRGSGPAICGRRTARAGSGSTAAAPRPRSPTRSWSRSPNDSRQRERPHLAGPGAPQDAGAGIQRRPRGGDIVDEHHARILDGGPARPDTRSSSRGEGSAHVAAALSGRQLHLRRRCPGAAEGVDHRPPQLGGQLRRLIEAPCSLPPRVQRNRHHAVDAGQYFRPRLAHQPAQRRRQRMALLVLEDVHESAKGALVGTDRPPVPNQRVGVPAARAVFGPRRVRRPGRQRIAAAVADGRGETGQVPPARRTDRTAGGRIEQRPARGAARRQQHREERVETLPPARREAAHDARRVVREPGVTPPRHLNGRSGTGARGVRAGPEIAALRLRFPPNRPARGRCGSTAQTPTPPGGRRCPRAARARRSVGCPG